ncbi:MAG: bifunctional 2-keto-4-hydroxyglutarate aldolase/2-keto-3-deoxy-6-phosphogluconate aldolase [Clostridia bacterium]|nr:bifunctional 2-keto-4-hydroxyglutarate aldolase/2-keto-3-deoxy-6-phosphogluconate aldolase [Clostridia bacterium]
MLQKHLIIKRITDVGVVAVVRANSAEEAATISAACIDGGIPAIEVTFTVPRAESVIKSLKETFSSDVLIVGAGTVLDSETARIAILNGAEYIVSPHFDEAIARCCNRYAIPYMAGCMTIAEVLRAMEMGVDIVKLFPGSAFGPSFVKAIKGPLPQANIMPTGGVSIDNVDQWIANGVVAVGVGGNLTQGTPEEIKEKAAAFVAKVADARK